MNCKSRVRCILLVIPLAPLNAAVLKSETSNAWNEYVDAARSHMRERVHSECQFLWTDGEPERSLKVRQGRIVVAPAAAHNPTRVPFGLIHDWIGAVFIPDVKIGDVLAFVRDYGRYRDFYKPSVVDSKLLERAGANDEFSLVLLDNNLLSHVAIEGHFESRYRQLDDGRWYSMVHTTRLQEIEDYGQIGERKLPEDQGNGYVWRLYSMAAFEERDGSVYMEIEAIALSRDIPSSLRLIIDPLVRRVSKHSLAAFLQKTREGVHSTAETKNNAARQSVSSTTS